MKSSTQVGLHDQVEAAITSYEASTHLTEIVTTRSCSTSLVQIGPRKSSWLTQSRGSKASSLGHFNDRMLVSGDGIYAR